MVHTLLGAALIFFILWIVGLSGAWAAHTAWTMFVIACALVVIWAIASIATGGGYTRRRIV
jgi:hypothetical protein